MALKQSTSVASISEKLTASRNFSGGEIMLGQNKIGSFVTYGKIDSRTHKRKTVYGSRIYSPVKIQVEAATRSSLLKKVAVQLSKAMKDGKFSSDY